MGSEQFQRERAKRRLRAKLLGADTLITEIYFNGLRDYLLPLRYRLEDIFPSITKVREPKKGYLNFNLRGKRYSIRTENIPTYRETEYNIYAINLKLLQSNRIVLELIVTEQFSPYTDRYTPQYIKTFIEGDWIEHFQELQGEITTFDEQLRRKFNQHKAEEEVKKTQDGAEEFGISTTDRSGSQDKSNPPIGMFGKFRRWIFSSNIK